MNSANEEELLHLRKIKEKLVRNRRTLELQATSYGHGNEPLHLINSINQTEASITEVEQKIANLESLLA